MVLILANYYASTLLSFLSVVKLEPIVNSLEELANANHLQLIIQANNELTNRLLVGIIQFKIVQISHTF